MAAHANRLSERLREGLARLNVRFFSESETNQSFPILPADAVRELQKDFSFYEWAPERDGMIPIRLVTAWGTKDSEVEAFLERAKTLLA